MFMRREYGIRNELEQFDAVVVLAGVPIDPAVMTQKSLRAALRTLRRSVSEHRTQGVDGRGHLAVVDFGEPGANELRCSPMVRGRLLQHQPRIFRS